MLKVMVVAVTGAGVVAGLLAGKSAVAPAELAAATAVAAGRLT